MTTPTPKRDYHTGNRVYYDKATGDIIAQKYDITTSFPFEHPKDQEIAYIDLPYGYADYMKQVITHVDPETKEPTVVNFDNPYS